MTSFMNMLLYIGYVTERGRLLYQFENLIRICIKSFILMTGPLWQQLTCGTMHSFTGFLTFFLGGK